jgi:hypothetical protein
MKKFGTVSAALVLAAFLAAPAHAAAIRDAALFTDSTLARNDDGSTGLVSMGFTIDFFGLSRSNLYVNNNGNATFDNPLSTFTPFALSTTNRQILAPFFADVDTRNLGSGVVQYGQDVIGGKNVFGINWINVGYFPSAINKLNSFQLIITERADIAAGDFDFEFNYDRVEWETGGASGGVNGLGGSSARMGWSNGSTNTYEQAGSAINGAFIDGGPNALISGSLNSNVAGRYIFNVRGGRINPTPEPGSLLLVAIALAGAAAASRKTRRA